MAKLARGAWFLMFMAAWPIAAQVWDNSGNNLLNGTYYFRHVTYQVIDASGDLGYAAAVYGTISFHGDGTYTMNTPWLVDSTGINQAVSSVNGNYTISASGYGFLDNPLIGDTIYGLVSNGVFVGSSTETGASGVNDMFVAVTTSTAVTSATFKGNYSIAYMNAALVDGSPGNNYDAIAHIAPDGQGNIGTVNFTLYTGNGGAGAFQIAENGVRYVYSNGAYNLSFPTSANVAVRGTQFLYISPDGNFVFGGSNNSWDMFVGVRKGTAASLGGTSQNGVCSPQCLYYQAGLSEDASQLASAGFATIGSYYGSFFASSGNIIGHQRFVFNDATQINVEDYTYNDSYPTAATGEYTSGSTQYDFSQDGGVRVGFGIGPFLGIDVAVRAPSFSGSGVWLDPTGVQNSASFAPFTARVVPGELLFLTGSGFTDKFSIADLFSTFPTTLGGVQVLINNIAAPIYWVSPQYIAVLVPFGTISTIAQIQVVTNQGSSRTVTAFVGFTAPGVFVANGYAIAQHGDYSLVTQSNPARPGEVLLVYMTGLGGVSPIVADGAVGPLPASTATNTFTATLGGVSATINVAELVPTIAGDYVIALTIPTGVSPGDARLNIGGPDSFAATALLPVGGP